MSSQIIVVTGASSGFGWMSAHRLADAGHTVYAGMRATAGRNADKVTQIQQYADEHKVNLRAIEMDVADQDSVDAAVARIISEHSRIDVLFHNVGHMTLGPAEAFTPEQLAQIYDSNVLGSQRVNRAVLPHMRAARRGLVVWNSSSSSARAGTPPYLAPYFAAKAAMDSLALSYAVELARFGIETSLIVPGAFTGGTNHFANAGKPADTATAEAYEEFYAGLTDQVTAKLTELEPADADPSEVARAVVRVVDAPYGKRPLRTHIDPSQDGAEVVNAVADRLRSDFYERIGLADLLHPQTV
ncbi:SDR family oxidoreductase [Kutzneria kofuensis]|uniref:NAD(P)-dependent dehydrogenase (Short-subunit alcohol dehydrogenase family) n=1 Tax=Kutzneria kofuensis TaxID=103725 RepID=A0A7W9KBL6_9PSEU|nr:SDR family oxidoreductase [Kutzneria kofuensis]MBB5889450.1 NAD(P)-dependent dehydrogenase (short-subunit alcohol dehydrogenase family) [Kutzneria kofuensis]